MCTGRGGGGRDVRKERREGEKKGGKRDGDARAIRCQGKESEFPFSRRSTEGIGPRAGSSYDRISHWRTRRAPAVDTSCHLSRLTTTGRSRSISDIPSGISNPLCSRRLLRRRRLFRASFNRRFHRASCDRPRFWLPNSHGWLARGSERFPS